MSRNKRRRQKPVYIVIEVICVLVFLASASVFLFPYVNNFYYTIRNKREITDFGKRAAAEAEADPSAPYSELLEALKTYNAQLNTEGQAKIRDMMEYASFPVKLSDYDIPDSMIGYVTVPDINVELPLFLGADYKNMADGAAVLGYSSAPIGGPGTNCVIAAHNTWQGTSKFRYISSLQPGAKVYITNLWGRMSYRVVGKKIIKPNEFDDIMIQPGKDMITLMTCHPYGGNGRYRVLVFCETEHPDAF